MIMIIIIIIIILSFISHQSRRTGENTIDGISGCFTLINKYTIKTITIISNQNNISSPIGWGGVPAGAGSDTPTYPDPLDALRVPGIFIPHKFTSLQAHFRNIHPSFNKYTGGKHISIHPNLHFKVQFEKVDEGLAEEKSVSFFNLVHHTLFHFSHLLWERRKLSALLDQWMVTDRSSLWTWPITGLVLHSYNNC